MYILYYFNKNKYRIILESTYKKGQKTSWKKSGQQDTKLNKGKSCINQDVTVVLNQINKILEYKY